MALKKCLEVHWSTVVRCGRHTAISSKLIVSSYKSSPMRLAVSDYLMRTIDNYLIHKRRKSDELRGHASGRKSQKLNTENRNDCAG